MQEAAETWGKRLEKEVRAKNRFMRNEANATLIRERDDWKEKAEENKREWQQH